MDNTSFTSVSASFSYMDDYITNRFMSDIEDFSKFKGKGTGFPNIDAQQFFYPGLYCVGGISSIGKTTFVHQLADQLAEKGSYVLYISLEQNTLELTAKSLARRLKQHSISNKKCNCFSAMEIRIGLASGSSEFTEQLEAYKSSVGNRMCILQCNTSITIDEILQYIQKYMEANKGIVPVIIIDYLQIIKPLDIGTRMFIDQKASIDHIVHTLKAFQMRTNATVIVVASLNRSSYQSSISFEAFKESGGIEYACDCVWGLQLSILDDDKYRFINAWKTGKCRTTLQEEKIRLSTMKKASR